MCSWRNELSSGDTTSAKVESFLETTKCWPQPTIIQEVRRFLGQTGFFRKFVKIAQPLTELTKTVNSPPFKWASHHTAAVEALKERLCNKPVLFLYDPASPHEEHTDATYCAAMAITKNTKPMVPRIARWWLTLQEYDYTLVHKPADVDAISRAPVKVAIEAENLTQRVITTNCKLRHIVEALRDSDTTSNEARQL